jgi:hypothetical protein
MASSQHTLQDAQGSSLLSCYAKCCWWCCRCPSSSFNRSRLVAHPAFRALRCCIIAQLPVKCKVEVLSFSAHADFEQTSGFLDALQPPHVVLVHGERGEMMKLKAVRNGGGGGEGRRAHSLWARGQTVLGKGG